MGRIIVTVPRLMNQDVRRFSRPTSAVKNLGFSFEALGGDTARAAEWAKAPNAQVEIAKARAKAQTITRYIPPDRVQADPAQRKRLAKRATTSD